MCLKNDMKAEAAACRVDPFIRDDAVRARLGAGDDGGVARRGVGQRVAVMCVGEPGAFIKEASETARH